MMVDEWFQGFLTIKNNNYFVLNTRISPIWIIDDLKIYKIFYIFINYE